MREDLNSTSPETSQDLPLRLKGKRKMACTVESSPELKRPFLQPEEGDSLALPPAISNVFINLPNTINYHQYLPHGVQAHICTFLSAKELCLLPSVSKSWRQISHSDFLWKTLFAKDKPHSYKKLPKKNWKRHYFYLHTLDYKCKQVYARERMRAPVHNRRLNMLVNLVGVITTGFGIQEIFFRDIRKVDFLDFLFMVFQSTAFIYPPLVNACNANALRRMPCIGRIACHYPPYVINFINTKALMLISFIGSILVIPAICNSGISPQVGVTLITSHAFLMINSSSQQRRITHCLGIAAANTASLCTHIGDLFRRAFCCRRGYL